MLPVLHRPSPTGGRGSVTTSQLRNRVGANARRGAGGGCEPRGDRSRGGTPAIRGAGLADPHPAPGRGHGQGPLARRALCRGACAGPGGPQPAPGLAAAERTKALTAARGRPRARRAAVRRRRPAPGREPPARRGRAARCQGAGQRGVAVHRDASEHTPDPARVATRPGRAGRGDPALACARLRRVRRVDRPQRHGRQACAVAAGRGRPLPALGAVRGELTALGAQRAHRARGDDRRPHADGAQDVRARCPTQPRRPPPARDRSCRSDGAPRRRLVTGRQGPAGGDDDALVAAPPAVRQPQHDLGARPARDLHARRARPVPDPGHGRLRRGGRTRPR